MMSQGRDYIPDRTVKPLKPSEVVPTATYMERGQRWMEKEEAVSLRQAMDDMDLKDEGENRTPDSENRTPDSEGDDESRIYNAALNEAAELVWQHQHPGERPEPGAPYYYRPHLRKNSYAHARTASAGLYGDDVAPTGLARDPASRSVSGSSTESGMIGSTRSRTSFSSSRRHSGNYEQQGRGSTERSRQVSTESKSSKPYGSMSTGSFALKGGRRRSSLKRNISGEVEKPFSGDHIWEEPEGQTPERKIGSAPTAEDLSQVQPLRIKPKNPLNRVQFVPELPATAASPPQPPPKMVSKYEIHRNPPTQSRNPLYTTNTRSESPPVERDPVPRKQGIEIRSDEIRQATSMRLKDRSAKLPTPSAVSDNPGRPIVSFDRNWKPPKEAADEKAEESKFARGGGRPSPLVPQGVREEQQRQRHQQAQNIPVIAVSEDRTAVEPSPPSRNRHPDPPSIQVDGPPIPTIAISDQTAPPIPTICLPDDGPDDGPSIPVIVTPDDDDHNDAGKNAGSSKPRPLPTPQRGPPRTKAAPRVGGHWSPAPAPVGRRATACCHECSQPIEGRFVSLAGGSERFHPQCFACYTCGTSLEALEISPEPEPNRAARLDRIARRAAGEILPESPGETMAEDGDSRLRFYCHLDWHELFAPRCKHCTTPILGEHLVALGQHWHYGHFFCAECGDPFERGMTHIEKDGYAWCVACQTKRTERRAPKCKKCRGAVIGQYVQALGGEWHDECFRCATCGGGFDDGQIFPMDGRGAPGETIVLCTSCRERELKA